MELDELKNTWNNASNLVEEQNLTPKMIDQMTHKKYHSKIKKNSLSRDYRHNHLFNKCIFHQRKF